ncbi:LysR family transcriptional regulator [Eggerthella sinensis]|uniref:LysR family transcriptional regulator n=1 Tax=Eggerthella sinensis TaxID=242230 RepID=UPI00266C602A|nr:LysR family transcriptional regulator [Eggerthella sinensis]
MEINHLREYIAFSTTMSFARTAKELFLSAPTLRSHIKLIESELGVPLLAKRDDRIEFTPTGAQFLSHAHKIVDAADTAFDECRAFARDSTSLLIRTYNYPPFEDLIATTRGGFLREHPEKHVGIRFVSSVQPSLDLVAEGKVDVSMVVRLVENDELGTDEGMSAPLPEGYEQVFYGCERGVCWITESNPLFDKDVISARDLEGFTLLLSHTPEMINAGVAMRAKFAAAGVSINASNAPFESYEEYFFSDMTRGFGIALYRDTTKHHYHPGMRVFELDDLAIPCNLYVMCDEENLDACGRLFWQRFKAAIEDHARTTR